MTGDAPVAERLGTALAERDETIAVAESCTGGSLGSTITGVPGASEYFVGGVISYTDRTKQRLLAVTRESLDEFGPVSEPVAREMAQHVRDEAAADWGVSTTGYAGPDGGSSDEPVGTVYVGVAFAGSAADEDPSVTVERHRFDGTRREVRERVTDRALASTLERLRETS